MISIEALGEMRRLRDSFYMSLASYYHGIAGDKGSVRNGSWAGKFVEPDHHRMIEESDHEFEIKMNTIEA